MGGSERRRPARGHHQSSCEGAAGGTSTTAAGRRGGGGASLPAHLASTAAIPGCLAAIELGGGGGGLSATRIMAPWSKMRSVEAGIASALDQSRYNSGDLAAKAHSSSRGAVGPLLGADMGSWVSKGSGRPAAAAGGGTTGGRGCTSGSAAGRVWRPLPVDSSRGTADTKIMKAARRVMHGLDLEAYK